LPWTEHAFHLDREMNVPTAFSVVLLLTAALTAALLGNTHRATSLIRLSAAWYVISALLVLMAIDEGSSLHERLVHPVRTWLGMKTYGALYFAWVIPVGLFALITGLCFIPFLRSLTRDIALRMVIAGLVFVSGAIGMEMLGAGTRESEGSSNVAYQLFVHIEEALEMAGVILFIAAELAYARLLDSDAFRVSAAR
jgi:hypothetical protein